MVTSTIRGNLWKYHIIGFQVNDLIVPKLPEFLCKDLEKCSQRQKMNRNYQSFSQFAHMSRPAELSTQSNLYCAVKIICNPVILVGHYPTCSGKNPSCCDNQKHRFFLPFYLPH